MDKYEKSTFNILNNTNLLIAFIALVTSISSIFIGFIKL